MRIDVIDSLEGLRAALEAPEGRRDEVFRERVMEPLRPAWEPSLAMMRSAAPPSDGDLALTAARTFGIYRPELGVEEGLAALDRLGRAGTKEACQDALHAAIEALDPAGHGFPLDRVRFTLVLADPKPLLSNPRAGDYTGVVGRDGLLWVQAWPTEYNLPRLPAAAAHEFHHSIRFRVEPFVVDRTTVGQYVVIEGLAEAFAAELLGEDKVGPWTAALSDAELTAVRPRFREALDVTGFDVIRGYVFGDWAAEWAGYQKQGLPDFAGYAIGYRLVREYLKRSGRTAAEATYLPWREIVEGSRYL